MFKNETVFLLGAGASFHYGYPTGEALVDEITNFARRLRNHCVERIKNGSTEILVPKFVQDIYAAALPRHSGSFADVWSAVVKDCDSLIERLDIVQPLVIDYFLGWNKGLRDIGRLAIAAVILGHQDAETETKRHNIFAKAPDKQKHWYRFITHKLAAGCEVSKDILKNRVQFITFNYDTSAERHLRMSLSALDLFSVGDVASFLKNRVIHVYGDVSAGNRSSSEYQQFRNQILMGTEGQVRIGGYVDFVMLLDRAALAAKGIRTIDPVDKVDDPVLKVVKGRLDKASVIYILGYGFDENNSARIGLNKLLRGNSRPRRNIMFTNFHDMNTVNKRAGTALIGAHDAFLDKTTWGHPKRGDYVEKSARDVYDALAMDFDAMESRLLPNTKI